MQFSFLKKISVVSKKFHTSLLVSDQHQKKSQIEIKLKAGYRYEAHWISLSTWSIVLSEFGKFITLRSSLLSSKASIDCFHFFRTSFFVDKVFHFHPSRLTTSNFLSFSLFSRYARILVFHS